MGFPKGLKPLFGFKFVEIIMMTLPYTSKKKNFWWGDTFPNAGMRLLDFISFQNPHS